MKDKLPQKSSTRAVQQFVDRIRKLPAAHTEAGGRIIFAMDATASRQPSWDQAMEIQADMFQTAAASGHLDIQLTYYRGHHEFYTSRWHSDTKGLAAEMRRVSCAGGFTQIEATLRHALKETRLNKVNAVIFVGDCVEENPDILAELAGQLGIVQLPVFVFQEGDDALAFNTMREMARLSGGAYCRFDQNSCEQLRDLLSAVAAYAVGGRKRLELFSKQRGGLTRLLTQQMKR